MKIEEAIQQKHFESEQQRTLINILYTAAYLHSVNNKIFKAHKLSSQQYNALRIIKGQEPKAASVQLINERMIDKASNGSRIVDKLVDKKLVTRIVCPSDRRQVEIRLTKDADALIQKIHAQLKIKLQGMMALGDTELQALNDQLDKIREQIQ